MSADSVRHEAFTHLGMGHLLTETFAIAHHNVYNSMMSGKLTKADGRTELGIMLAPHF
jgi:hypothetical protein